MALLSLRAHLGTLADVPHHVGLLGPQPSSVKCLTESLLCRPEETVLRCTEGQAGGFSLGTFGRCRPAAPCWRGPWLGARLPAPSLLQAASSS